MPNTDVDTTFAQPAATVAAVAVPSAGERVRAAILAQEAVVLTLHNRDSGGGAARVVLFKKNSSAPDAPVLAWKVVRCPPGQLVRVVVPFPQQIGVFDRHGVHAGVQNAFAGDSLTISSAASQADARAQPLLGRAPPEQAVDAAGPNMVSVANAMAGGAYEVVLYKDGRPMCRQGALAPGATTVFEVLPYLHVAVCPAILEGEVIDGATVAAATRISLLGLKSADLVFHGASVGAFNMRNQRFS